MLVESLGIVCEDGVSRRLGLDWLLARDVCDQAGKIATRNDIETVDQSRLDRVAFRDEDSLEPVLAKPTRGNEDAIDVANGTIESKLPNECGTRRCGPTHHRQGYSDRHRQIKSGAFFTKLRRRQVHGEPFARKLRAAVS